MGFKWCFICHSYHAYKINNASLLFFSGNIADIICFRGYKFNS